MRWIGKDGNRVIWTFDTFVWLGFVFDRQFYTVKCKPGASEALFARIESVQ